MKKPRADKRQDARRGFTLVEMLVAGVLTAFMLGSISICVGQLSRAKETSKERLDAYLRADNALHKIRGELASVLRSDDLFDTRFLLDDRSVSTSLGDMSRDELLLFSTKLRPIRSTGFNGEGAEYETQFRIEEDGIGTMLWKRRDPFPDEYPEAGGLAVPLVENILSLEIEAYDGDAWYGIWDSDFDGLPEAVRVTLLASGARPDQDPYEGVTAALRTVVPIDRVIPPSDLFRLTPEEEEEIDSRVLIDPAAAAEAAAEAGQSDNTRNDGSGGAAVPGRGGRNNGLGQRGRGGAGRGGADGASDFTDNVPRGVTRPPREGTMDTSGDGG